MSKRANGCPNLTPLDRSRLLIKAHANAEEFPFNAEGFKAFRDHIVANAERTGMGINHRVCYVTFQCTSNDIFDNRKVFAHFPTRTEIFEPLAASYQAMFSMVRERMEDMWEFPRRFEYVGEGSSNTAIAFRENYVIRTSNDVRRQFPVREDAGEVEFTSVGQLEYANLQLEELFTTLAVNCILSTTPCVEGAFEGAFVEFQDYVDPNPPNDIKQHFTVTMLLKRGRTIDSLLPNEHPLDSFLDLTDNASTQGVLLFDNKPGNTVCVSTSPTEHRTCYLMDFDPNHTVVMKRTHDPATGGYFDFAFGNAIADVVNSTIALVHLTCVFKRYDSFRQTNYGRNTISRACRRFSTALLTILEHSWPMQARQFLIVLSGNGKEISLFLLNQMQCDGFSYYTNQLPLDRFVHDPRDQRQQNGIARKFIFNCMHYLNNSTIKPLYRENTPWIQHCATVCLSILTREMRGVDGTNDVEAAVRRLAAMALGLRQMQGP